uniref:Pyruvate kinase n=1 Tax=Mucochytrium quahogii TaxID=96639 RepID=A0A7S2W1R6_9STRA|mmetsp:Transcript_29004/g.46788  ORF Transcript_29004/g.46788 Transcript_29004/m.46788 type:complete len:532 (+) Transcript_29004:111-1706(+)|eukprot:CAMPEP_0203750832 /NCGR_PEP_ID=MMETSP0098-20131031/5004_1 /ASSEMBLY_ACC=CAM_ASM_000208 /TAXON_ID=96639 /ORGANISM=" , Strain NY0313808BC1" /LENGTH=531 /DNA_ID=CAMNT_0050640295 /DNA_START=58 /DNA_END=1653 /DNA_ORIENTATION=+
MFALRKVGRASPALVQHANKMMAVRGLSGAEYKDPRGDMFSMTKVVGTIGPTSEQLDVLQKLTNEGLRIMRMNFSHATYEEATLRMTNLRKCRGVHSHGHGRDYNLRAVLLDTQGPEIRCGKMEGDEKIVLEAGKQVIVTTDTEFETNGSSDKFYCNYAKLGETVKPGDTILLDDGLIRLTVDTIDGKDVSCTIQNTEKLGNRKGINLPGLCVDLPGLTDKDREDIAFGVKNDVDFVAASFIRRPSDVLEMRSFIDEQMAKHWPSSHPAPKIISKIENYEGVSNFDEILKVSDGIMVARGDLGVEIPIQKVLSSQKMMVQKCNQAGKPVIVATQMLESMIKNPRPTRAEVADVGNAVLEGADAVMLSGEVAYGDYPVESVETMMSVIKEADTLIEDGSFVNFDVPLPEAFTDSEAVASSAVKMAHELDAKLIIVMTGSGDTARLVAKHKPRVPVMAFADSQKVGRQLQLHRALFPIVAHNPSDGRPIYNEAIEQAKDLGWIQKNDRVIVLSAEEETSHLDEQILLRVATAQ